MAVVDDDEDVVAEAPGGLVEQPSWAPGFFVLITRRLLFSPVGSPRDVIWCVLDGIVRWAQFPDLTVLLVERAPHLFPHPDPSNPGCEVDWKILAEPWLLEALVEAAASRVPDD